MKKVSSVTFQVPSAAGPNLKAVEMLYLRAKAFEDGQLSTTEKVYQPIVDHGEAHRVAIEKMTKALAQGDNEAMKKYFDEARYHEEMQRQAGIQARQYFLGKVQVQG